MLGRILLCASLAVVAATAFPRSAAACGACACYEHDLDLVPSFSRHLPLNARLFALVPGQDTSAVRWVRESDKADVPIDLTPAGGPANAWWIAPHDPLEPDTEYRITTAPGMEWVLTTGQATDTTAPEALSATVAPSGSTDLCADVRGGVLKVEQLAFGPDQPDAMVLQLDVNGPDGVERLFLRGAAGSAALAFGTATSGEVSCLGARALHDAQSGVTYSAQLTAFDAAGNAKSIDLAPFQLGEMPAGGCGPAGGTGGGGSGGSSGSGCALSREPAEGWGALIPFALLALARFGSRAGRRRRNTH